MPMYTWLAVMLVNRPSSTVASSSAGLTLAAVLQAFASWKAEGVTLGRRGCVHGAVHKFCYGQQQKRWMTLSAVLHA